MKKFFVTILCVGLFAAANSVWASGDNQQDKAPVKKESVEKKVVVADAPKACCAEKKEGCCDSKASTASACCSDAKASCPAKAGDAKACCAEKESGSKATASCTNTKAAKESTSSGKK